MKQDNDPIEQLLVLHRDEVLREWLAEVAASSPSAGAAVGASAAADAAALLDAFVAGLRAGADAKRFDDIGWEPVRNTLETLSRARAARGSLAGETSHFVLALKKPLFSGLQQSPHTEPQHVLAAVWRVSTLVDRMAQFTMDTYQRSREEVIRRQQEELLELSTPVVKLWDGVLAVPMIGTLDSSRTQLVMESLLQRIVDTGSELAIIDITGVPTVDTLVAQHLLKTVTAIRLMGADCIISGVRPQIAQTIVHLGIDLQGISTKASLADALALAMKRVGYTVTKTKG
ncbi:STAS domain-containing protein [Ideonella sp. BN130291]|uniref:STAS domain-containing protein n=1 Tax=Ideonella sp. BN130291 TaxID=3112940 RepID=UPI002E2646FA|nr:STAS domain-containing protein [Ideonella sp. BN130291]